MAAHATSTTGYNNSSGGFGKTTSRTPSPVQARQSPTSTSSPRYSDSANLVTEKKGTTPPPPPRISDDLKGTKHEDKKVLNRNAKRGRHDSGGKGNRNFLAAEAASDNVKKRRREENTNDKNVQNKKSSGPSSKKASNVASNARSQKNDLQKNSKSSHNDDHDRDPSSSPSPPPTDRELKSRGETKDKEKASTGINFKVKGRLKIKKEKNPFRIPKKGKGNNARPDETRTPSPQSFTNEGPLVEFNEGRSPLKGGKRQGAKNNSTGQSKIKKSKLNNE